MRLIAKARSVLILNTSPCASASFLKEFEIILFASGLGHQMYVVRLKYCVICVRKNLGHSISVWRISAVVSQAIRSCAHFLDPTGLWSSSKRCDNIMSCTIFTKIYAYLRGACSHLVLYGNVVLLHPQCAMSRHLQMR